MPPVPPGSRPAPSSAMLTVVIAVVVGRRRSCGKAGVPKVPVTALPAITAPATPGRLPKL